MQTLNISQLSAHLFWDVDQTTITVEKHTAFIVHRILEYGVMEDWLLLRKWMSVDEIANIAKTLRELDDISLNFIATISGTNKASYRCYTTKQSLQKHWPS